MRAHIWGVCVGLTFDGSQYDTGVVIGDDVGVTIFGLVHLQVGVFPGELLARIDGLMRDRGGPDMHIKREREREKSGGSNDMKAVCDFPQRNTKNAAIVKISPTLASSFISEAMMAENSIDEGNSSLPSGGGMKHGFTKPAISLKYCSRIVFCVMPG